MNWAQGYARQARADLDAFNILRAQARLPRSQSLHFLQMACEKLVKAHLCVAGSDPLDLRSSHAYIAQNLPLVLRNRVSRLGRRERDRSRWLIQLIGPIAREIELLAPAVTDGGARQSNCEYPWEERESVIRCPAEFDFPNLGILRGREGLIFLRLLRAAIEELC
jgi:hypothetical protein